MALRESLNYSHDILTGRKLETVKNKIITPARGSFKIELFDSLTGKKTYEAESENRITAVLSNVAYMEMIYNSILDSNSPKYIYNTYNAGNSYTPNRVMILTDADRAEDPYDPFIYGNIKGYADLWAAYAGSESYRGTINESETKRYDNTKHFVVDFPTNAANGTFSSIYTVGSSGSTSPYTPRLNSIYYDYRFASSSDSWKFNKVNLCVDETNIYALKSDETEIAIFDKNTFENKRVITIARPCKSITYDRVGNFWGISTNGKEVYKFSKDNWQLLQTIAVPTGGYYTYSSNPVDISVNEGFIYIICRGQDSSTASTNARIVKIGKDGVFFKNKELSGDFYYITKLQTGSEFLVSNYGDRVYFLNDNLDIIYNQPAGWSRTIHNNNSYAGDFTYDWQTGAVYRGEYSGSYNSYTNYLLRGFFVPALSHTLLPEPITKTPTNTMKIQYDITVDRVPVFAMPPH